MSYKSQFFSSRSRERLSIGPSWGSSTANLQEIKLLSPWIEYDYNVRPGLAGGRVKWNTVLGLGLATAVSASIWAGIVLAVARIFRG
ncbi:MAG TPA: hypothetical protein VNX26_05970 [Candidatus Acidoferrum sp.]|jgi:hypothetical protein|nr:hypothetical protein [Candidatus Acidoferrum sp.]